MSSVCIDYGHGGNDSGACSGYFQEKAWNLDTGKSCKSELEKYGVKVYETRTSDQTLSIDQRCKIANQYKLDYFISIHHNAGGGDRGEVIHSISNSGKPLADKIANELQSIGQSSNKVYSRKLDNSNKDYYGVIRGTTAPSVIVEVCFIDNSTDRQIADTLVKRQRNGVAIAHGILKQLGIAINNSTVNDDDKLYAVCVGAYNKTNADKMLQEVKSKGYRDAYLIPR